MYPREKFYPRRVLFPRCYWRFVVSSSLTKSFLFLAICLYFLIFLSHQQQQHLLLLHILNCVSKNLSPSLFIYDKCSQWISFFLVFLTMNSLRLTFFLYCDTHKLMKKIFLLLINHRLSWEEYIYIIFLIFP